MKEKEYLEKIALSLLVKYNEPPEMVKRCIVSLTGLVDDVFVTITKDKPDSDTSAIENVLKEFNAHVSFFDWCDDFAKARNFAFSQIPQKEFGWIYWQDVDDVLQGAQAFPGIFHDAILNNWQSVFFNYWYAVDLDENGKVREVVIEHKRERIIRNDDTFKWIGRIHETLIEQKPCTKVFRPECIVVHLTDASRQEVNIDRNIRILEASAKEENHKDPRTIMYLAKAYFDRSKMGKDEKSKLIDINMARQLFFEYLEGAGTPGTPDYQESSGWDEERSSAWSYLSEIYRMEGQYNQALKCSFNSLSEAPQFPAYYLDIAMIYTFMQQWNKAEHWLKVALNVPIPNTTLITNPRDLKSRALEIDYHIAFAKQDIERAQKAAEKLREVLPGISGIDNRLQYITALKDANKASQCIAYLARYLEAAGEPHKISSLVGAVPKSIEKEQFVSQIRNQYLPARIWGKDEVAIVCGPGFEKWSPKNLKTGIGGSEEAVIYLGKELAKLGYKVTVYGDPREDAGEYEGVKYLNWFEINQKDSFNILVLWRNVRWLDNNFAARQTYLWLHDVPANPEFTKERIDKIDKIFVLSEYHKSLLRMATADGIVPMPEQKVLVTGNGISSVNINKKWKRDPFRMIWTSSYDRGLPYLLNMWPDIKKEVPEANLHIYYGWNLYDFVHASNPARVQWKAKVDSLMNQEGITHHGRVGHAELHRAFAESGIWSYPTDFSEISCISAMKAQAYGAYPVCTNFAALKETVHNGVKVDVDITEKLGQEEYKKKLIEVLKNGISSEEREKMMKDAKKCFAWSNVANYWDKLFKEKISTKTASLLTGEKKGGENNGTI